jgi:predicted ATPase
LGSVSETLNSDSAKLNGALEFGGTFSLGQDFFRPMLGRQNRVRGDQLNWDLKLLSTDNNDYSGLANVFESKVQLMREKNCIEEINVTRTGGTHVSTVKFEANPRFSYDHRAIVLEHSLNKPIDSEKSEEYSAVSFASGLPIEGLILKPRLQILLDAVTNEWREITSSYRTFVHVLEMRIASRDQEELFPAYKSVEDALKSAIDAFESLMLKSNQNYENDLTQGASKIMLLRSAARQIVDFSIIPWHTISKQLHEGLTERHLLEMLQKELELNEDFEPPYDDEIKVEIDSFIEKFTAEVRRRFANSIEAKEMDFDERIRGVQRGRQTGSLIYEAVDNWNYYLTEKIRYLEPLREVPKAFYTYATGGGINQQIPIGSRGEHLAQALYDKTPRVYPLPSDNSPKPKMVSLIEAVNMWLPYLDIEGKIEVVPQGRQGFSLTVGGHVLPMLGTGISQILPVLTICLTARRGDLILLEQPELHLNPSIQQKLAEFLLEMSKVDRQIIVETHSEYFVTRLRLIQARDEKNSHDIKLLFVEKTTESGTIYREVETNSFGEIQDWPKGFFDQASNDLRELMKAIASKKAKKLNSAVNTSRT